MTESISLRKTFGEYLEKLGGKYKNLAVLDSDLSNSLYSLTFAKSFPERHFTVGQGENAMLSMAAGLAARGKLPVVCGETAQLLNKGLDSLKNSIASPNLNIKIVGSNSGVSNAEEGSPRECVLDIALLNAIPNLKILCPADSIELKAMMDFMMTDFGPVFLRLPRHTLPNLYDQNYQFRLGQPEILKNGDKIVIFSYGHLLHEVLKTSSELASRGISSEVVNVPTLKPLQTEKILETCRLADLVFVVEDHLPQGGLGSIIIDLLYLNNPTGPLPKVIKIALESCPETAAHYEDALNKTGLCSKAIYEKIRESWVQN
jgi:transketolase